MSLNLKINIQSPKGITIAEVDLPQINTENTLAIIGKDDNLENQIERLIEYFRNNTNSNNNLSVYTDTKKKITLENIKIL